LSPRFFYVLPCVVLLASCGGDGGSTPAASGTTQATSSGPRTVEIKLTDAGCSPAAIKLDAGRTTFKITNAGTGRVSEAEVLSGQRILGEKENLVAGLSGSFTLDLQPGQYTLSCPGGITDAAGVVTVGGGSAQASADPLLQGAVTGYQRYVTTQAKELVKRVQAFVDAVKAGDVEKAKALFAPTRINYEAIEPIAELFSDLDVSIDSRADDYEGAEADPAFPGFHRIEYGLWEENSTEGLDPVADKLLADVNELAGRIESLTFPPEVVVGGAAVLMEEVAATKISGEEDRYSHTDLWDFKGNFDGSQKIVELVKPLVVQVDPAFIATVEANFATIDAILDTYKDGDGYVSYEKLTEDDRVTLAAGVNTLAEDLSTLRAKLGLD
jgi:iron uptake system component EfeO